MGRRLRGCWEGGAGRGVAAVPVDAGGTDVATTTRELPSEDESVSLVSATVRAVELTSPSVPLVNSKSVVSPSRDMWDAAPSCSGATAPPPDDANAHKNRETTKRGGRQKKDMLSAWITATVGGKDRHISPLHYTALLGSTVQFLGNGLQGYERHLHT
ncbi:hypothetical protein NDU88_009611 [Pleurodeles waltl]|uniref:Uncharacterized protein n=1 Tax=Pleurodeles waltl TaxID=8319 RepID=A0AAV7QS10_PLEWA|nr:hypothetical protein NDU88_009611 [Pleurodeles waltl]